MHGNTEDLKNQRFGNLVALELTDLKLEHKRGAVWKCKCDCGNICYKTAADLKDKRRKTCSCGCMSRAKRKFPNKFVQKTHIPKEDRIKEEFAINLLSRLKDAPYIEELRSEINQLISDPSSLQIPCEDCISRQAVIEMSEPIQTDDYSGNEVLDVVRIEDIKVMPPVTPIRLKGHWIDMKFYQCYNDGDIETTELKCSRCKEIIEWNLESSHKPYFCENCGADMRESENINV